MNYNRVEHLKSLHQNRKECTRQKVDAAILKLIKLKAVINFNSVAKVRGVSKATLYNHADIRKTIEDLRFRQSQASTPAQVKYEMTSQSKDALIESLKRKIEKLTRQNKELHEQLKHKYADFYEQL